MLFSALWIHSARMRNNAGIDTEKPTLSLLFVSLCIKCRNSDMLMGVSKELTTEIKKINKKENKPAKNAKQDRKQASFWADEDGGGWKEWRCETGLILLRTFRAQGLRTQTGFTCPCPHVNQHSHTLFYYQSNHTQDLCACTGVVEFNYLLIGNAYNKQNAWHCYIF